MCASLALTLRAGGSISPCFPQGFIKLPFVQLIHIFYKRGKNSSIKPVVRIFPVLISDNMMVLLVLLFVRITMNNRENLIHLGGEFTSCVILESLFSGLMRDSPLKAVCKCLLSGGSPRIHPFFESFFKPGRTVERHSAENVY